MVPSTGVVIPSAGQGSRMGSGPAKQLLPIAGSTVLGHTIRRILELPGVQYLVIPTSPELREATQEIVSECMSQPGSGASGQVIPEVITGGRERMDSVRNGLMHLSKTDAELVLVHDAVRPCFSHDAVRTALQTAYTEGAAILAVPSRDTVKIADGQQRVSETPDRKSVWMAQTPQIFRMSLLLEAYRKADQAGFAATDDASVVEFAGFPVHIVPGSQENIKITYPSDLYFVEQWLSSQN